jgi:hypothetical protein
MRRSVRRLDDAEQAAAKNGAAAVLTRSISRTSGGTDGAVVEVRHLQWTGLPGGRSRPEAVGLLTHDIRPKHVP